jgi:hypothetical protein
VASVGKPNFPTPPAGARSGPGPRPPGRVFPGCCWLVLLLILAPAAFAAAPADPDTTSAPGSPAAADSSGWQWETEFHLVAPRLQELKLAHPFVDAASLRLFADGRLLLTGEDYRLRAREGLLLPLQPLAGEDQREVLLVIHYRFRPFPAAPTRELHAVVPPPRRPEAGGEAIATGTIKPVESTTGDLSVRGSKTVRVASGRRSPGS